MIGVLRCGDDAAETSPTSGTERLDDLVAYLRDAGLEATLDAEGYCRADVPRTWTWRCSASRAKRPPTSCAMRTRTRRPYAWRLRTAARASPSRTPGG
ncbi:hypothetical protein [Eggerthella sinensis]|uniref:hypothetical protein n=1 Tax=Eggerthella sinensis TaxID=242230 RepID=UPI0022E5CD3D|nr:hypothetical protein [Eggerthella sinensis]